MRVVLSNLRRKIEQSSKFTIVLFTILSLTIFSCSKKQIPFSSARYIPAGTIPEMQQFMNGGVGRNLDTARKKPNQIIKTAEKYMGTPHCMGGTTKKCMDCSGADIRFFFKEQNRNPPKFPIYPFYVVIQIFAALFFDNFLFHFAINLSSTN